MIRTRAVVDGARSRRRSLPGSKPAVGTRARQAGRASARAPRGIGQRRADLLAVPVVLVVRCRSCSAAMASGDAITPRL